MGCRALALRLGVWGLRGVVVERELDNPDGVVLRVVLGWFYGV
jgi:hypothetical protein